MMQARRCQAPQQRSPSPAWHQHQYRPAYPERPAQLSTAVRTSFLPQCSGSGDAHGGLVHSSALSTSGPDPLLTRTPVSHHGRSVVLNIACLALLLEAANPDIKRKRPVCCVKSRSTSILLCKDLLNPEALQKSLLMKALARAEARPPSREFSPRGSRLSSSRDCSGDFSLDMLAISQEYTTDQSVYQHMAQSVGAMEV